MTRHRRSADAAVLAVVLGCVMTAVAGCAGGGEDVAGRSGEGSPTPTAACPAVPGVELPPECAPYDPDAAMAANHIGEDSAAGTVRVGQLNNDDIAGGDA